MNGGSGSNVKKYVSYDNATLYTGSTNTTATTVPAAPTKPGYSTFNGWYTTSAASGGYQIYNANGTLTSATVSGYTSNSKWVTTTNRTLYARFSNHITYNISYNLDGGTHGSSHPTTATYDTGFTVSNPTKPGYTFAGWNITGMDGVTHYYGDSSSSYSTTTATSLSNITKTWFKNLHSTASSTVTFTAQWTPRCNAITVHIKARGGYLPGHTTVQDVVLYRHSGHINNADWWADENCSSTRVKNFAEVSPYFTLPKKDNAGFAGVYSNPTDGYAVDYLADYVAKDGSFQDIDINSDVEAWAHFICEPDYAENGKDIKRLCEKNYSINLSIANASNEGTRTSTLYTIHNVGVYLDSLRTEGHEMSSSAYPLVSPTRTGYSFSGYYSGSGGTGTQYISDTGNITDPAGINAGINASSNQTWYGKWTPNTYTVRFMSGSTELGTQSFTYGSAPELTNYCTIV